jgi:hypothetical protein
MLLMHFRTHRPYFYLTNIVCHIPPQICQACRLTADWAMIMR